MTSSLIKDNDMNEIGHCARERGFVRYGGEFQIIQASRPVNRRVLT